MIKSKKRFVATIIFVAFCSFVIWKWLTRPPIEAVSFSPPPAAKVVEINRNLEAIEVLDLQNGIGPEDVVVGADGSIYTAMVNGDILKMSADHKSLSTFLNTGGRPLGLAFDHSGNLIVADPYKGLLRVSPDRKVETLIPPRSDGSGSPAASGDASLCYANNVDVAPDGMIYFTDSTERFCPPDYAGTFEASMFDIAEHQYTGRFMSYNPKTKEVRVLATGIQFANGVSVSPDGKFALIAETGDCRILRYQLSGEGKGEMKTLLDGLSGYPDNLTRGLDGRYWLGFTKPRSKLIEALANYPRLRQALFILIPARLRPVPPPFGHIIAIDVDGNVLERHQDPEPHYPDTTGATETPTGLYIHSLHAHGLGLMPR